MQRLVSNNRKLSSVLFVVLLIISLEFMGCSEDKNVSNTKVNCVKLKLTQVQDMLNFEGNVVEKKSTIYTAQTTDRVKKIKVSVGERIKKNQVICSLDTTNLKKQYQNKKLKVKKEKIKYEKKIKEYNNKSSRKKEKSLVRLKDEVNDAEKNYKKAKKEYEDVKNDSKIDSYEIKCYEKYSCMIDAKNSLNSAKQLYEETKWQLDNEIEDLDNEKQQYIDDNEYIKAKKACSQLKKRLDNNVIRANSEGIVSEIYVQEGDIVSEGKILKLADENSKEIIFNASEDKAINIEEGMQVNITSQENDEDVYKGQIKKISKIVVDSNCEGCVSVQEEIPFMIGMRVSIDVITQTYKDVYKIESGSVFEDKQGKLAVYIAVPESDEKYMIKQITLKNPILLNNYYIVGADNFKEGDVLITDADDCSETEFIIPQF